MTNPKHLSGALHVCGKSRFTAEEHLPANLHYVAPVFSQQPHAKLNHIDISQAIKTDGVKAVLTAVDIPGHNNIAHGNGDNQPLLPTDIAMYQGQPIALVVATSAAIAEYAAGLVKASYTPLTPVFDAVTAQNNNQLYLSPLAIERGDLDQAFADADIVVCGTVQTGAQEHFYFETQRTLAIPDDDGGVTLSASTQSTAEVQEVCAHVLGLNSHKVTVDVHRLGGAFGGKESQATLWAGLAALAANHTGLPVLLKLRRIDDLGYTGKRHPFTNSYRLALTKQGKILGYEVTLRANGGAYTDLSVAILERAMFHSDSAYYIPNIKITGYACRTNLPPNTAYRGFGAPQGIFTIEHALQQAALVLGMDQVAIRNINCYTDNQTTPFGMEVKDPVGPQMLTELTELAKYKQLQQQVQDFNANHTGVKRGLGVIPGKFGISFTTGFLNQGSSLVWIYADGTVSVSHGGVEMGQQVNTKVAQVVAQELGIGLSRIRIESANTKRVGNASPTAASTGSDINGFAALYAAQKLKTRLTGAAVSLLNEQHQLQVATADIIFANDTVYSAKHPQNKLTFTQLIRWAYMHTVDLGAHGYYYTPGIAYNRSQGKGTPFYYYVFGAALVQMEINLYTGEYQMVSAHIVHDASSPINSDIDLGQIQGAFVQGFGYCTMEELPLSPDGRYLANTPSTYKIPAINDIPKTFEIKMLTIPRSQASVLGSKAVGEPPFIYGLAAWLGLQQAVYHTSGLKAAMALKFPATPQAVLLACHNQQ